MASVDLYDELPRRLLSRLGQEIQSTESYDRVMALALGDALQNRAR